MSIAVFSLGVVSIVSSATQAGFQLTSNSKDKIGVSSSSGFVILSVFGFNPLLNMCWPSCLAARVSAF